MSEPTQVCPGCESPECLGPDECRNRQATNHVIGLLTVKHGQEVAEFWAWEMTPMPAGFPSDEQLGRGVRMAFASRQAADEERAANMAKAMSELDSDTP